MQAQRKLLFIFSKINRIHFNAVPSNPCARPSLRIKIFFLVINMCRRTHIYSKDYTVSTKPTENFQLLSSPMPYPEHLYSSISLFLVKLTAPSKQFSSAG